MMDELDGASLTPDRAREIATAIEGWYGQAKRDLPWRRRVRRINDRGWRCLVAEAMLQQTQVSRVIDRFQQFIDQYPTPAALASAPEQEVLALWQGLGYYRRARHLQAAAQTIVEDFGGRVPRELSELRRLPGVGRYTAGAIASIAFGVRSPLVDGNVMRVLTRLFAIDDPLEQSSTQSRIWALADSLVGRCNEPGAFNQGLMELGSLVCTPQGASCHSCPVSNHCAARRENRVGELPHAKPAPKRTIMHAAAIPIRRRGRWLLIQRPPTGLWASMWQTPTRESSTPADGSAVTRFLRGHFGLNAEAITLQSRFTHHTSHRQIEISVWSARRITGRARTGRWVAFDELASYPISNAQRRILAGGDLFDRGA